MRTHSNEEGTSAGGVLRAFEDRPAQRSASGALARRVLSHVLTALHFAVISVFVVGWALPWRAALVTVVVLAVVVQGGWWACNDRCWLTMVDEWLCGPAAATEAPVPDGPPNFLLRTATRLFGRPVSRAAVDWVARGVLWTAFAIAAGRLALER